MFFWHLHVLPPIRGSVQIRNYGYGRLNKSGLRLICNGFVRDRIHEQIRRGLRQQYMPLISRSPAIDAGFSFLKRTRPPYPQSVSNELVRSGSWWKYALKNGLRVVAQNTEGMVRMNNGFALGGFGCGGRR